MANLLSRVARAIAGPRRPRSHAIDPKVMEAGRWMEDIRREQYGQPGEIVRAMVIVEVRVKPDDPGTAVLYSTDRSEGYQSGVEAAGMLHQGLLGLELAPHAAMLNQLGGMLAKHILAGIEQADKDDGQARS